MRAISRVAVLAGLSAGLLAGSVSPPSAVAAQPGEVGPPLTFDTARALLDALEASGEELGTLATGIQYTREFAIQGDTQTRRGRLYLDNDTGDEDGRRRFAILFEELVVGERRTEEQQHYIFDGMWVVEKTPAEKQFTKRQVARPGEDFDPLRIGEGPFPIPIGQPAADILERFDAELIEPADGLADDVLRRYAEAQKLLQLRLIPKAGSRQAEDFDEVRIWFDPRPAADGTYPLLPMIARTVAPIGDESLVVLFRPTVNSAIDAETFDTAVPPEAEGWNVHISELREAVGP